MDDDFNIADAINRSENIIRSGTIAEVDNKARKMRVKSADLLSDWISYPAQIGNNFIAWTPMRVGTQVVLACPSGDFAQAICIQVLFTDDVNSPSTDADTDMIKFNDGTIIKKDGDTLSIDTPCAVTLTSPTATIDANTTINGNTTLKGAVVTIGTLTNNGVNVGNTHTHPGVQSGASSTGLLYND